MFDSAATSFLNSFFRENTDWIHSEKEREFHIPINPITVIVPYVHKSISGRHLFRFPLQMKKDNKRSEISFLQFLDLLKNAGDVLKQPDQKIRNSFIDRAKESYQNARDILAFRKEDIKSLFSSTHRFIESEQGLLNGHSVHPCPKSKDGFTPEETQTYAPEFKGAFQLEWFAASPEIIYECGADHYSLEYIVGLLVGADSHFRYSDIKSVPKGYRIFPSHPWQAEIWKRLDKLTPHFASGRLISLGKTGSLWKATSSLRALHNETSAWMLKFSMSVKLTNSVRHLQLSEMVRGKDVYDILNTKKMKHFFSQNPQFSVLKEPISIALKDEEKNILSETVVLWRENPFTKDHDENVEVLATLLQDHPETGQSRLAYRINQNEHPHKFAVKWFDKFLSVVLVPFIKLYSDCGIAFGAHQQNIVIKLEETLPVHTYFRDCQGAVFSESQKKYYTQEIPRLKNEPIFYDAKLLAKWFSYYFIINTCFNVISSISNAVLAKEEILLMMLQNKLLELREISTEDQSIFDYLLNDNTLISKGNFYCSLKNINENTMEDPLDIYHKLPNPLKMEKQ